MITSAFEVRTKTNKVPMNARYRAGSWPLMSRIWSRNRVTSTSSPFCQRDSSGPVDRRLVINHDPPISSTISAHVVTMVRLRLTNPASHSTVASGVMSPSPIARTSDRVRDDRDPGAGLSGQHEPSGEQTRHETEGGCGRPHGDRDHGESGDGHAQEEADRQDGGVPAGHETTHRPCESAEVHHTDHGTDDRSDRNHHDCLHLTRPFRAVPIWTVSGPAFGARRRRSRPRASSIVIGAPFLLDPVPRRRATHRDTGEEERERETPFAVGDVIEEHAEGQTQQCRERHRPPDEAERAEERPRALLAALTGPVVTHRLAQHRTSQRLCPRPVELRGGRLAVVADLPGTVVADLPGTVVADLLTTIITSATMAAGGPVGQLVSRGHRRGPAVVG